MTAPTPNTPNRSGWPDDVRLALPAELRRLAEQLDRDGARLRSGPPADVATRIVDATAPTLAAARAPGSMVMRVYGRPLRIAAAIAIIAGAGVTGWLALRSAPSASPTGAPLAARTGVLVDQELDVWLQPTSGWDNASLAELVDLNSSLASLHERVSDFWTPTDDALAGESL